MIAGADADACASGVDDPSPAARALHVLVPGARRGVAPEALSEEHRTGDGRRQPAPARDLHSSTPAVQGAGRPPTAGEL